MNTSDFAIFLDVARLGSFAAAARLRNTAPSSISRSVQALELELGVRLFQRSTRQVTLTEAGDLLLSRAAPLIKELDHAISDARALRDRPVGLLRLTASIAFGDFFLMPRLRRFRDLYPDVTLECIFTDAFLDLVADRIDLAIRLAPAVEGDVIVSKLIDTRYRVVATPGYLASAPGLERPGDLAMHGAILYNQRPFSDRWLFRDAAGTVTDVALRGDIRLMPAGSVY